MDIKRIVQRWASRASETVVLGKVEDYVLGKLYKEPTSKKNEDVVIETVAVVEEVVDGNK